ncbi:MAG: alpha/beta hydrolase [Actinomycetes bacterium]
MTEGGAAMRVPGRRIPLLATAAVAAGVLAGVGALPSSAADRTTALTGTTAQDQTTGQDQTAGQDQTTGQAAVPHLQWGECQDGFLEPEPGFDCATATVPLDYTDPRGATIDLALKRHRADDRAQRIGSLFINPGGPGGSGVDFVTDAALIYGPQVLSKFDVIGFDPRGVARSAPLICFDDDLQVFNTFAFLPAFPVDVKEGKQFVDEYASYTARCAAKAQPILDHMSTGNVVRDLDLLRAAVGDDKLTYAGYSYGTLIGTTYANMFPNQVRAVVLDGVLDPVAWTTGKNAADAATRPYTIRHGAPEGTYATFQQFVATCAKAGPDACPLAKRGDPQTVYADLAERLKQKPVDVPLGYGLYQRFDYPQLVGLTQGAMYDTSMWPLLAQLVADLDQRSDPAVVGERVQQLRQRLGLEKKAAGGAALRGRAALDAGDDEQFWQTVEGFDGVGCLDSDNPPTVLAWPVVAAASDLKARYFGSPWTWASTACATWPGKDTGRYTGPWTAATASPVLVIGNRYDPATPYSGAERVAHLLPSSRLLTLNGSGHTALAKSRCIDDAVSTYLVTGALPAEGTVCQADAAPFEAVPAAVAAREDARQQVIAANIPLIAQH